MSDLTPRLAPSNKMLTNVIHIGDNFALTPTGAVITGEPSFEDYNTALYNCQTVANGCMWTLGDLLNYGENRGEWGDMYSQALELTQKSYDSLSRASRMSRLYPKAQRVPEVSWSHHLEAASLRDETARTTILHKAAEYGWSRDDLRQHVTTGLTSKTPARPSEPSLATCPECGHEFPAIVVTLKEQ